MRKIIFGLVLVSLFLPLIFLYYNFAIQRPNFSLGRLDPSQIEFTVKPGEKVYEIAASLKEARLINSPTLFKIYVKLNHLAAKLQAGSYKIRRDLSLVQVISLLQHGTFDVRLTFPEGWRREEMADYLAQSLKSNDNFSALEFLRKTEGAEGYLFPDTYVVPYDATTDDLIRIMRENFRRKVAGGLLGDLGKQGLNLEAAVTLASIIEREVNRDEDRSAVAGILLKRWRAGWPLDADATVQYALSTSRKSSQPVRDWWPKTLSEEDLRIDSPYNTRKNVGLPPSPICNPGLSAIRAVVYPLETPYWYYLTDRSGVTHYAKTLEEQNANISRYLP